MGTSRNIIETSGKIGGVTSKTVVDILLDLVVV